MPGSRKNVEALVHSTSSPSSQADRIVVKTSGKFTIKQARQVRYIEAAYDDLKVYTAGGAFFIEQNHGLL